MSMKSSNDLIGNRTRELPACRPAARPEGNSSISNTVVFYIQQLLCCDVMLLGRCEVVCLVLVNILTVLIAWKVRPALNFRIICLARDPRTRLGSACVGKLAAASHVRLWPCSRNIDGTLTRRTSGRGGKDRASSWASACDFSWNSYRPWSSAVSAGCGQQHRLLRAANASGQASMNGIPVPFAQNISFVARLLAVERTTSTCNQPMIRPAPQCSVRHNSTYSWSLSQMEVNVEQQACLFLFDLGHPDVLKV
jgi:hypothetical protein